MAVTDTCISCQHWNPQGTDRNMLRLGFAQCKKKPLPGYTTSAHAAACAKHHALPEETTQGRVTWLAKQ